MARLSRAPVPPARTRKIAQPKPVTETTTIADQLAYVLREWVKSHSTWAQQMVNGSHEDADGFMYPLLETPCECQHCVDARMVLADCKK